jgi:arylsulfatase A-like enzyme
VSAIASTPIPRLCLETLFMCRFRTLFAALSIVAGGLFASTDRAFAAPRPNVLVIITDDQRADCLSCAGHPHLKTPHIDRLAQEGVRFRNAFCTTSLCSPSRATILSGLYASKHGVTNNFTEYPVDLPSFPKSLQKAGYRTAYIGKWHMGEANDLKRPGFDHFVTHKGQGKYFDTEFNFNGTAADDNSTRRVVPGYYTHVVTDIAVDWLKERPAGEPWLLMLGQKAPHSFYVAEPKYATAFDSVPVEYPASAFQLDDKPEWFRIRLDTWHGIYGPLFDFRKKFPDRTPSAVKDFAAMTRAYWGTILSVDDSVGRLYEHLRATNALDNTLIVFTGDNGILNGEHGMVDKRTMHEPSIRVPLVARYPALTKTPGRVCDELVLHTDLAPTVLELCGAEPLPGIQGRSWAPLVRGDEVRGNAARGRDAFFYEYNYEKQFPYTPNVRGVRTRDWKYVRYPHGDGSPDRHLAELYDLAKDPEESHNLIRDPAQKERIARLSAELDRLIKEAGIERDVMPLDAGIKNVLPDLKIR